MGDSPRRPARPPGRALGIDYGRRRVGVALSDALGIAAYPLEVLAEGPALESRLTALVDEHGVVEVVVGLPTSLDGSEGASARAARSFAERVTAVLDVGVVLYDERFTSKIARRVLIEGGASRAGRRAPVDGMAAAVMLQGFLDRRALERAR